MYSKSPKYAGWLVALLRRNVDWSPIIRVVQFLLDPSKNLANPKQLSIYIASAAGLKRGIYMHTHK